MEEQDAPENQQQTAWHPLLVLVIAKLAPKDRKVFCEFLLNRLPQRVDIVVVQQQAVPAAPAHKLKSIFDHLRKHTLIEFKSANDDLERSDVTTLLAYAGQYMSMHELFEPEELMLMVIADRIAKPFVDQVERMEGTFVSSGDGLWRGRMAGLPMHGVALRDAYKSSSSERLLYSFTKAFLNNPRGVEVLDEEDVAIYTRIVQQIEQFRRHRATMALRDLDQVDKSFNEALAQLVQHLPPKQRLAGLTPEQRFAGLTPEQIAAVLPPEVVELVARKLKL